MTGPEATLLRELYSMSTMGPKADPETHTGRRSVSAKRRAPKKGKFARKREDDSRQKLPVAIYDLSACAGALTAT